jgi:hypothetical protein
MRPSKKLCHRHLRPFISRAATTTITIKVMSAGLRTGRPSGPIQQPCWHSLVLLKEVDFCIGLSRGGRSQGGVASSDDDPTAGRRGFTPEPQFAALPRSRCAPPLGQISRATYRSANLRGWHASRRCTRFNFTGWRTTISSPKFPEIDSAIGRILQLRVVVWRRCGRAEYAFPHFFMKLKGAGVVSFRFSLRYGSA